MLLETSLLHFIDDYNTVNSRITSHNLIMEKLFLLYYTTKIPDFPIRSMCIISKDYSITAKTKVRKTLLKLTNIKQNKSNKIKNRNKKQDYKYDLEFSNFNSNYKSKYNTRIYSFLICNKFASSISSIALDNTS